MNENYEKNLKDYCVSCLRPYKNSVGQYITNGNYCKVCNNLINKSLKDKVKRRATLQDKLILRGILKD